MEEKKDYKLYLDTATLAGKLMLQNGAEIYRVEDTIQRMLAVSGLKTAEAYVTATGIMVTLDDPKEDSMTVIKRIPSRGTDLNTVSIVNDISRKFCSGQMTLKEAFHDLKHLDSRQYTEFQKALGVIGVALFFALVFGGSWRDALAAGIDRSVPPAITADTGMDVFTHAMEAYVSTQSTEFSAALSEKAIEICGTFLLRAYLDGNDTHARKKMHIASCLAGLSFNAASLGINHSLAHQLGAHFHIAHGRANAMLLPHIIEYNSMITKNSRSQKTYPRQVEKYCTIARLLGVQNFNTVTTIRALVAWVQFMLREMDIPLSISQTGKCTRAEYFKAIPDMAEAALQDACTPTNPRQPSKDDIMEIYERLW